MKLKTTFFTLLVSLFSVLQAQPIRVWFNQSVDNTVSSITDAQTSSHLDDTICAFINSATTRIDVAVWDNGSSKIVSALNDAYNRGVVVRYISSDNSSNDALSGLNSGISILERDAGLTSNVMHNKFIIFDEHLVLSGSMNFGAGSMFDDYNNVVVISDSLLAEAYTIEFEEMWGGSGATPSPGNSKFGPDKSNNTPHNFTVDGSSVECYFSPTDETTNRIIDAINTANQTLDIAIFTFINNDLGDAVVAAKDRGVQVRCIMENILYFGSEYGPLLSEGIDVQSHMGEDNDFHHKYCIIDANSSDPTVVTGSHNWTNSAEEEYDENTLIIHDVRVAHEYLEEFTKRWQEVGGTVGLGGNKPFLGGVTVYPNPSAGIFYIDITSDKAPDYTVFNWQGSSVYSGQLKSGANRINLSSLASGAYVVQMKSDTFAFSLPYYLIK